MFTLPIREVEWEVPGKGQGLVEALDVGAECVVVTVMYLRLVAVVAKVCVSYLKGMEWRGG